MLTRRKLITTSTKAAAAVAASRFFIEELWAAPQAVSPKLRPAFEQLDRFVEQYMREMGAPGMTLVIAGRSGVQRIATYGLNDVERRLPVTADHLFHIGSISKSFLAIALLQLREQGKLDLHRPITDYLPWFKLEAKYGPVTTHNLLTHSSGLPGAGVGSVFFTDPDDRHIQGFKPGEWFHYNNMAYSLLGYLVWTLDGRNFGEVFRERIFKPVGMTASEPIITSDIRERTAKNYSAFHDERPFPRAGRLAEAPGMIVDTAAGSVASTPRDMGLYMQMLINRGEASGGRVLSPESFELFSTTHQKAEAFGPTASYGYGIGVDTLDGHKVLRHTGGMVSFMSAMHIDMDEGVGAFASINAQQGYRPNPVTIYALKLMRAVNAGKAPPPLPAPNPPTRIEKASEYAGVFTSAGGKKLEFVAEGTNLFLLHNSSRLPVELNTAGYYVVRHPEYERSGFVFGRENDKDEKSPVTDVAFGEEWYTNGRYTGPREFTYPKEWDAYTGHYRNDNPWAGSIKISKRKGKLWADLLVPLEFTFVARFRLADNPHNPEWIEFRDVVNGKSMHLKVSGDDMWRVWA